MPVEGNHYYEDFLEGAGIRYDIDELIFSGQTKFQEVLIFSNRIFGKVLVLDGIVQTSTADEFIYHEMLAHVPIFALGDVKQLLVVGGGDGGVLRQVLRHPDIQPTIIDIDAELVEICKEHLWEVGRGAFDDPRVEYLNGDGLEYLNNSSKVFDLVIVDATDPLGGPGDALHSKKFFEACKAHLHDGGVVVTQSGTPDHEQERIIDLKSTMGKVFDDTCIFLAGIPCFFGGSFCFGWGCDDPKVRHTPAAEIEKRFLNSGIETNYYTPAIHVAAFSAPQFVLNLLNS